MDMICKYMKFPSGARCLLSSCYSHSACVCVLESWRLDITSVFAQYWTRIVFQTISDLSRSPWASVSTKEMYILSIWMRQQPCSVRLCTYITLNGKIQEQEGNQNALFLQGCSSSSRYFNCHLGDVLYSTHARLPPSGKQGVSSEQSDF